MSQDDSPDQLALFPAGSLAKSPEPEPVVRPWRPALADAWADGEVTFESLEPYHLDLLRRNRELLKALRIANVPDGVMDVEGVQEAETVMTGNYLLLRRGQVAPSEAAAVARSTLEAASTLAAVREKILRSLEPEQRRRVLQAESRVRIHDYDLHQELAALEFEIAEQRGELVEFELPPGFFGPSDVDALAEGFLRSMKEDQEKHRLPGQGRLRTLLKDLPVVWLNAVCEALDVDTRKLRHRQKREAAIAETLTEPARLRRVVREKLGEKERELLSRLLEKDGRSASSSITRRFGSDEDDGWFWNESPPTSVLGRVRVHGLAFVGRTELSGRLCRTVLVPRELRNELRTILGNES